MQQAFINGNEISAGASQTELTPTLRI